MAIGVIKLHVATLDARLVIKVVKVIIKNNTNVTGRSAKADRPFPIAPFRLVFSFLAASESAVPAPEILNIFYV